MELTGGWAWRGGKSDERGRCDSSWHQCCHLSHPSDSSNLIILSTIFCLLPSKGSQRLLGSARRWSFIPIVSCLSHGFCKVLCFIRLYLGMFVPLYVHVCSFSKDVRFSFSPPKLRLFIDSSVCNSASPLTCLHILCLSVYMSVCPLVCASSSLPVCCLALYRDICLPISLPVPLRRIRISSVGSRTAPSSCLPKPSFMFALLNIRCSPLVTCWF